MSALTHRARKILFSLVAEHIATGLPVGSRTLSRRYMRDLSPATIRNVLADLEDAGYLAQPHTSAGRVPTAHALLVFVEAMTEFQPVPADTQARIQHRLSEIYAEAARAGGDSREPTGRLLSELAGTVAVVAAAPAEVRKLALLRFIPVSLQGARHGSPPAARRLLAVLVFSDGSVDNRYIEVDGNMSDHELERVHNLLGDVVEGRSLPALRDLFARRLDDQRSELDALRRRAFDLGRRALTDVPRSSDDVVVTGQSLLMDLPEYAADAERLRQLLRALEDRENLLGLLDQTLHATPGSRGHARSASRAAAGSRGAPGAPSEGSEGGVEHPTHGGGATLLHGARDGESGGREVAVAPPSEVSVYIGAETGELSRADLSLVVAPYGDSESGTGTIGVIGPTRMDYARVVPLVGATAAAITAARRGK